MIGGGAAGIELSMSVTGRWKPILGKDNIRITLLDSGDELLPHESTSNRQALRRVLAERGIEIRHGCYVDQVQKKCVRLKERIPKNACALRNGSLKTRAP